MPENQTPQDTACGIVLLVMIAEGKLNDKLLSAERFQVFRTKASRDWPPDMWPLRVKAHFSTVTW